MNSAIERLNKILALERQQGYRNKSVIGGFARLVERWHQEAAEEATSDYQRALLQQIVDHLLAYADLDEQSDRRHSVDEMQRLASLWDSTPPADFQPPETVAAAQPEPQREIVVEMPSETAAEPARTAPPAPSTPLPPAPRATPAGGCAPATSEPADSPCPAGSASRRRRRSTRRRGVPAYRWGISRSGTPPRSPPLFLPASAYRASVWIVIGYIVIMKPLLPDPGQS